MTFFLLFFLRSDSSSSSSSSITSLGYPNLLRIEPDLLPICVLSCVLIGWFCWVDLTNAVECEGKGFEIIFFRERERVWLFICDYFWMPWSKIAYDWITVNLVKKLDKWVSLWVRDCWDNVCIVFFLLQLRNPENLLSELYWE